MDFLRNLLCEAVYEVTNTDSGKTVKMTQKEAENYFGRIEFQEMLAGQLPNWAVMKLEETAAAGATAAGRDRKSVV